jgi:hypothetical protein
MSNSPTQRDRHGRGMRRPLHSRLLNHGLARRGFFESVVVETCEYLRESFPERFANLSWEIEEVPMPTDASPVERWHADKSQMRITLYRIPIQRLGKLRIPDPRMQIEQVVISAAAALIDVDPWELIHPN